MITMTTIISSSLVVVTTCIGDRARGHHSSTAKWVQHQWLWVLPCCDDNQTETETADITPCPRKKQATSIFAITSKTVEIFVQFLKHFVQE